MKKYFLALLLSFVLFSGEASATQHLQALSADKLVQTVPIDTKLGNPNLAETSQAWIQLIDSAKSQILISQFYVSLKEEKQKQIPFPMNQVVAALQRATARGVKVFALADIKFYENYPTSYEFIKAMPGVELVYYDISKRTGGINHSKYWVIDDQLAYVGSANFDWRALAHIHEMGLVTANPGVIAKLFAIFSYDWIMTTGKTLPVNRPAPKLKKDCTESLQLFASPNALLPKGISPSLTELRKLIRHSKKSIEIEVPSFKTKSRDGKEWYTLYNDLQRAAKKGVRVKILLADTMLKKGMPEHLKKLAENTNIEIQFITVPLYRGQQIPFARLIHSKMMIVDDETLWLSTSNWEKDYFYNSRNIDLVSQDLNLVHEAQKTFDILWNAKKIKSE